MKQWQKESVLAEELYSIVSPKLSNFAKQRRGLVLSILTSVIASGYRKVEIKEATENNE